MSKKQTAVEYYEINHRQLLLKLENKQITVGEYAVSSFDLYNKALQMEREQIEEAFEDGWVERNFYGDMTSSEYYTQTYGECTQQ